MVSVWRETETYFWQVSAQHQKEQLWRIHPVLRFFFYSLWVKKTPLETGLSVWGEVSAYVYACLGVWGKPPTLHRIALFCVRPSSRGAASASLYPPPLPFTTPPPVTSLKTADKSVRLLNCEHNACFCRQTRRFSTARLVTTHTAE